MVDRSITLKNLLEVNAMVKPEEKILVITDDNKFEIGKIIYDYAKEIYETSLMVMTPRKMHGDEPTEEVASAMLNSDVIFAATSMSMYHSDARRNSTSAGRARYINLVDYTPEMFLKGGLTADFILMDKVLEKLREVFRGGNFHITAPGGTFLTCSVKGREPVVDNGRSIISGQTSSPPNGEIALGPVEGTANGVIVVDGSIPHPKLGLIKEKITFNVKNGSIVEIIGGEEADIIREILASYNDSSVYNIGEVAIPVNYKAKLCGRMLEDEGAYTTMHIGIGDNISFGGIVEAPAHIDMVIKDITCHIDGRLISKDGILSKELLESEKAKEAYLKI